MNSGFSVIVHNIYNYSIEVSSSYYRSVFILEEEIK